MSKFDFKVDAEKTKLLSQHKYQDEPGAMRPRMFKVLTNNNTPTSHFKLQWMYYGGMGNFDLSNLHSPTQNKAAKQLIKDGKLVPTSTQEHYELKIQRLTHFDDVNWAKTPDGNLIIFNLCAFNNRPEWPDEVITPDETHDTAIASLKAKTEYGKTMEDEPITLRDGSQVIPILTDTRLIEFRKRQQGLIPRQG